MSEYICQDCGKKQGIDEEYIDRNWNPRCAWCLGFLMRVIGKKGIMITVQQKQ